MLDENDVNHNVVALKELLDLPMPQMATGSRFESPYSISESAIGDIMRMV